MQHPYTTKGPVNSVEAMLCGERVPRLLETRGGIVGVGVL